MEVEYVAACEVTKEVLWLKKFLTDVKVVPDVSKPITLYYDYNGVANSKKPRSHKCKETNLVLNWEKCHFMVTKGIVLGHKVFKAGLEIDDAKIDVIAKCPAPANVKALRSFLGHTGFYRRLIKGFSQIASPLSVVRTE
ncbi:uncharacterized mitochondrial protein AtMg00860-like [Benincasa hispida]|uniref:uncharacterized mitochondrial protein AtMg00860-like n=1 Tax=Benincasa hispida TaxID=102211 RepID=UPI0019005A87|nr:uncharacterized mitochondrial protein AtMg00860-like [Benincasa hispida]